MNNRLLIPDYDALCRKFANPQGQMAELLLRFRQRLDDDDADFRRGNIFLLALLGEEDAVAEARQIVLDTSKSFLTRGAEDGSIEHHTWCTAPTPMRMAVYYTWLAPFANWTAQESADIAGGLLHFCYEHPVNVMRSRTPGGHNQAHSMALTCAIVGAAFADMPAVADRAIALRNYGMESVYTTIGLMARDGYTMEGSTYQSHVVSPLIMWTAALLSQLQGQDILKQHWQPSGVTLLDLLQMEYLMVSPGLMLPPWDHYGWQQQVNLAAISYWASVTGYGEALQQAGEVWDREDYIAWGRDDRMWTLVYWPDGDIIEKIETPLGGWALPQTGATIDHTATKSRVMLAWDGCAGNLQGLGRAQTDPNNLIYEVNGVPIFGDGISGPGAHVTDKSIEEITAPLSADERRLISEQYGSLDTWANGVQSGFIGASNAVIIDGEDAYFQRTVQSGHLVHELRQSKLNCVTGEAMDFYRPRYDITRARRTVAVSESGLVWSIDDYRADSTHDFAWRLHLRQNVTWGENCLQVNTPEGADVTMAWLPGATVSFTVVPGYPAQKMSWPDDGSTRLELGTSGMKAQFVVCWLPRVVEQLKVVQITPRSWGASWVGGEEVFTLPDSVDNPVISAPHTPESVVDLDFKPFALLFETSEILLANLQNPLPDDWRRTCTVMQTLISRECIDALPLIQKLLVDPAQRYQVHSVAAWCLGRMAYQPALEDLQVMSHCPEVNTALRAGWGVERILEKQK
jgi:hypothetical protein